MGIRGLSRIIVAAIVALLVVIPFSAYPAAATGPLSGGKTVAAVPGEHSQELAALIAEYVGAETLSGPYTVDSADVVVFSGMNPALQPLATDALEKGGVVVIAGVPGDFDDMAFSMPEITITTETISLGEDVATGTLVQTGVIERSKEHTVVLGYLVYVLYKDDEATHCSRFAALESTAKQRDYVSEYAAQKVASVLVEPASLGEGSADQWTLKRDPDDSECLIILSDFGDQLYSRHDIYQLNYYDEQYSKDYWRVDSYIDHYLPSFQKYPWVCGPYVPRREISVDCSSGATIQDYDPHSTPGNVGASVGIDFNIRSGGVSVGIGYSYSWSNPGVTYLASADVANSRMGWVEQFAIPNYIWPPYPLYSSPTVASHYSYNAMPSVVMRTTKGSNFYIDHWTSSWTIYLDVLPPAPPIPYVNRFISTYTFSENWLGFSSMFGGGGGGCPFLQVWDGSDYVDEGLLDIHNAEGTDVIYEHTLAAVPEPANGRYAFRLTEHPVTISDIDQVQLRAILEDGTMQELPLKKAWHSGDGNVRDLLLYSDDLRAEELGADHNGGTSQSIDLEFGALGRDAQAVAFIFAIEGYNMICKTCM
jgi:hypothetical protein